MSKQHQGLLTAYRATDYRVPTLALTIRIDRIHPVLDTYLRKGKYRQWCLITADNPSSQLLSVEENIRRQQAFRQALQAAGWSVLPARNVDTQGHWPIENSWLICDMPQEDGRQWAQRYGQLAYLYGEISQPARLVWTKPD